MQPQVINIRDAPKGWQNDPRYVYIGRFHNSPRHGQIPQSKWHNPFKGERKWAVAEFTKHFLRNKELMEALPELTDKILICWCFGAGTLITTKRGFVPIEDIVVDDMVLSHDSQYHRVMEVMKRENIPTVKVKFQGIPEPLVCTPNHEFYASRRLRVQSHYDRKVVTYPPSWIPAEELRKNLKTSHSLGTVVGFPVDTIFNHNDDHDLPFWYFVGRYLGDGWLIIYDDQSNYVRKDGTRANNHRNHVVALCTGNADVDNLEEAIKKTGNHYSKTKMRTETTFRLSNKKLALFLTQFGKYSYGKFIPEWCFSLPLVKQKALLSGIIDADGSFDAKRQRITVTTVSPLLAFGIARLIRNVYRVNYSICKKDVRRFSSFDGERKFRAKHQPYTINWSAFVEGDMTTNCVWLPFREIRPGEPTTVYNLSVDGSESYIANGIAVHNCKPLECHGDTLVWAYGYWDHLMKGV